MKLNAPSQLIFVISLIIAALAVIGEFTNIQYVTQYKLWIAIAGYVVLAAGCLVKM